MKNNKEKKIKNKEQAKINFILETLIYDSIEYGFANKIDENDESLNIYKLVYNENGISKVLEDEKIINILLPLFEKLITKEINEEEIYNFIEQNIYEVVRVLKEKNVPKSEELTDERINEVLVEVKKEVPAIKEQVQELTNQIEEKIKDTEQYKTLEDYKNNLDNTFLNSMLIDSSVVVASDDIYILSCKLDSTVNLINLNKVMIEEKLDNVKIAAITEVEWLTEKQTYINNIKNGYNYEIKPEIEESNKAIKKEGKIMEDSIEDIAEKIFSNDKIEVE